MTKKKSKKKFELYINTHNIGDSDCQSCLMSPSLCQYCEGFIHNEVIFDIDYDNSGNKVDDAIKVTMCETNGCTYNNQDIVVGWRDLYLGT